MQNLGFNPYLYKTYYFDKETKPLDPHVALLLRTTTSSKRKTCPPTGGYYNPQIGRFLSRDPKLGNDDNRLGKNEYIYAENNPISNDDPDGLRTKYNYQGYSLTYAKQRAAYWDKQYKNLYNNRNKSTADWNKFTKARGTAWFWYDQVYGAQKQIKSGKHKNSGDGKDKSRTKQEKATDRSKGKKDVKKVDPKYNKKTVPKKVQQNDRKIANKMFINDLIDYPGGPGKLIGIGLGIRKLGSKFLKPLANAIAPAKRTKGITVLGKYPNYVKVSDKIGARRFDVPIKVWNKMSSAERWTANKKFLDRTINRGDDIVYSEPILNTKNVTGDLKKELDYLMSNGYHLSKDGRGMVKF